MTTLTLTYTRFQKRVESSINSIELPSVNWRVVCFLGFFASLSLIIFYIFQINALTQGYYLINSYEKQVNQLLEEKNNLDISFAESSFLGQALEKTKALNFQRAISIKYIQIPDNLLAKSK